MSRNDHLNHEASGEALKRINRIRKLVIGLDETIQANCPLSREQSIALTKLEECRMWAISAIAKQETPIDV